MQHEALVRFNNFFFPMRAILLRPSGNGRFLNVPSLQRVCGNVASLVPGVRDISWPGIQMQLPV